jgi:hypothetical protein
MWQGRRCRVGRLEYAGERQGREAVVWLGLRGEKEKGQPGLLIEGEMDKWKCTRSKIQWAHDENRTRN